MCVTLNMRWHVLWNHLTLYSALFHIWCLNSILFIDLSNRHLNIYNCHEAFFIITQVQILVLHHILFSCDKCHLPFLFIIDIDDLFCSSLITLYNQAKIILSNTLIANGYCQQSHTIYHGVTRILCHFLTPAQTIMIIWWCMADYLSYFKSFFYHFSIIFQSFSITKYHFKTYMIKDALILNKQDVGFQEDVWHISWSGSPETKKGRDHLEVCWIDAITNPA